jgi:diamine N-acetyltransferase
VSIQVRTADPGDVDHLVALAIELHEFTARGVPDRLRIPDGYDLPTLRGLIEGLLADPETDILVAVDGDGTVGFAEVHAAGNLDDPVVKPGLYVKLQSLLVTRTHRGRGIGALLVDASRRWAADRGIPELRLDCWEFDEGPEPFYLAMGFRTVKREMAGPAGD